MSAAGLAPVSIQYRCWLMLTTSGAGSPVVGSRGMAEPNQSAAVKFDTFWSSRPSEPPKTTTKPHQDQRRWPSSGTVLARVPEECTPNPQPEGQRAHHQGHEGESPATGETVRWGTGGWGGTGRWGALWQARLVPPPTVRRHRVAGGGWRRFTVLVGGVDGQTTNMVTQGAERGTTADQRRSAAMVVSTAK